MKAILWQLILPHKRHIWHYKHENADIISKAIEGFDWDKAFSDKSTDKKALFLQKLFSMS